MRWLITMSDNQSHSRRFRQSQHGDDAVVATVLSVNMKVALMTKRTQTWCFSDELVDYEVWKCADRDLNTPSGPARHSPRSQAWWVASTSLLCWRKWRIVCVHLQQNTTFIHKHFIKIRVVAVVEVFSNKCTVKPIRGRAGQVITSKVVWSKITLLQLWQLYFCFPDWSVNILQ